MTGLYGAEPPPARLAALLAVLRYKDWTFTLCPPDPPNGWRVFATVPGGSCCGDGFTIATPHQFMAESHAAGEDQFWLIWLQRNLRAIEVHRCDHAITVDGARPFGEPLHQGEPCRG